VSVVNSKNKVLLIRKLVIKGGKGSTPKGNQTPRTSRLFGGSSKDPKTGFPFFTSVSGVLKYVLEYKVNLIIDYIK
jgi:hypothetical protein